MKLQFRTWTHGLGTTTEATVEGETLGEIIEKAVQMSQLDPNLVQAAKLEIDGHVMRMRRMEEEGGDVADA